MGGLYRWGLMRTEDLEQAVYFLRRVVPGRLDEERLLKTVEALEREIERRKHDRKPR